ncbi:MULTISPECIES: secondary thiamine-phosphate synthase enzyme YjbQ [Photorhabdus]|uniref:Secondary thiamine-phosphate synthase enzyme YjbQ n=2 Tax=Photorhabdus TaxID=29487 RepID=A0AAW6BPI1_9GAMM|nr:MULTISPECIES: secondary thiamine-phosphate synthase enzyme YjbQ [Photorhabdus]EYU16599.1 secondary thiamine-phosphate synthase enzyme [Photorhabdus aegyptia]MDB6374671.1 secondary thiamine-phosphate synthase enzyme YjbQ [Photorhabdus bodei]
MAVFHDELNIETGNTVSFDDITEQVQECVKKSGIKNGLVNVFSQHTSCGVFIQEDSEDVTYRNIPLLLQDMLNVFEKIIPTCQHEGQYLHPGPIHTKNAAELRGEKSAWMLNTDGHLRSVLLGRSETIPLLEGEMTLGEFGRIYFSDMDQTRERNRRVRIQVIGE